MKAAKGDDDNEEDAENTSHLRQTPNTLDEAKLMANGQLAKLRFPENICLFAS